MCIVPPNNTNFKNIIVPCGLKKGTGMSASFFIHLIIDEIIGNSLTLDTTLECKIPHGTSSTATVSDAIAKIYGVK